MSDPENELDLRALNERFTDEENAGNRTFFEERLAGAFAFRRANASVVPRGEFLDALKAGGARTCDSRSIDVQTLGQMRALVTCRVAIGADRFLNARLFVKDAEGRWRLLAWANERE